MLRLNVTNSTFSSANLDLFGGISFDFDNNGTNDALSDSFVQNFFLDGKLGGATLYSNWLAGNTAVTWHLDTNVFPPVPTNDQLFVGNVDLDPITDGLQGALIRQSVLDGSIDLTVPEPGSLALLGLGLAGLGLAKRRRMLSK